MVIDGFYIKDDRKQALLRKFHVNLNSSISNNGVNNYQFHFKYALYEKIMYPFAFASDKPFCPI